LGPLGELRKADGLAVDKSLIMKSFRYDDVDQTESQSGIATWSVL
jgi:hypothetical protein